MEEKINILICDDNPAKLETISAILEDNGIEIIKATNGEEAVYEAKSRIFALIILDVLMPGMDGFQTAGLIRNSSLNKNSPIIFITDSYFDMVHVLKGYQHGAVDYLTSPIIPRILQSKATVFLELFRKNKKLEQFMKRQEKFYSVVSHDLRGPFQPILGFLDILVNDLDNLSKEEIREFVGMINTTAVKLYDLLIDLLEMTRLNAGDFVFVPAKVNPGNTATEVVELLSNNAGTKNIHLANQVERGCYVIADAHMFRIVLQNLVSNAIKFTGNGGTVIVSSEECGEQVKFHVADNGIGIQEHDIEKLFARDIIFSTNGTGNEVGTGLGLSICKEMTEKMNGSISVKSVIGEGTTFTVTLPVFN